MATWSPSCVDVARVLESGRVGAEGCARLPPAPAPAASWRVASVAPASHPGRVNSVFFVRLRADDDDDRSDDGDASPPARSLDLVLKLTNPRWRTRKTRSEANALLNGARLGGGAAPVPRLHAFDDDEARSAVPGREYLLMERVPGRPLRSVWPGLARSQRLGLLAQIARVLTAWRRAHTFSVIGNFTGCRPEDVGNLVALEWTMHHDDESPALVGPLASAADYLLAFLECHLQIIERRADPLTLPLAPRIRALLDTRVRPLAGAAAPGAEEAFYFTHADFSENNLLVDGPDAGAGAGSGAVPRLSGIIDFEWAFAGPADTEFHRGFRWIRDDPEMMDALWRALADAGLAPAHRALFLERHDLFLAERLVSAVACYTDFFPADGSTRDEGVRFCLARRAQLERLLERCGC